MENYSKSLVRAGFALLTLVVFMFLLSPLYLFRSVQVEFAYTSSAGTTLNLMVLGTNPHSFSSYANGFEKYSFEKGKHVSVRRVEIPTDDHVGCLAISFQKIPHSFTIERIIVIGAEKRYPIDPSRFTTGQNLQRISNVSDGRLRLTAGRDVTIVYSLAEQVRTKRRADPVMLLYAFLFALLPASLVFCKTDIELNRRSLLYILYAGAAVFMLIVPILRIDFFSVVSRENRTLHPFPEMFICRRFNGAFFRQFEEWFSDRFTGRKWAIEKERAVFAPNIYGDCVYTRNAIILKNNWMYHRGYNSENMYQNKNRFTQEQLELCAENLQKLNDYFKKRHIRLYVVMTPDKERIYPEHYPARYRQVHPESRLEQVFRFLSSNTDVRIIFPLYELLKEKGKYRIYAKAGTHWTSRGAYVAFRMLHEELKKDFPEMPSDQPNAETWRADYSADYDIALQAGYTDPVKQLPPEVLFQEVSEIRCTYKSIPMDNLNGEIFVTEYSADIPRKHGLKIFACTDSFWGAVIPFLFPCTNQMIRIFFGYGSPFHLAPFAAIIEKQKPDVVVIETTERFLDRFLELSISGD